MLGFEESADWVLLSSFCDDSACTHLYSSNCFTHVKQAKESICKL